LRTSRFFPEEDDSAEVRPLYAADNVKANEFLFRRVDVEDVVSAHLRAMKRAAATGFGRCVITAATPFTRADLAELRVDAPAVVRRLVPAYEAVYRQRGWTMFPSIDRVYVSTRARRELGWRPRHDFASLIERLAARGDTRSPLARQIGSKGYHAGRFEHGPYPVE